MDSEEIFLNIQDFVLSKGKIDGGYFGHVFVVKEKKTSKLYAAKELDAKSYLLPKAQQMLIREVINMKKLHHAAIIEFKGFTFISFNDPSKWQPTIYSEFVENKSLQEALNNASRGLAPEKWSETTRFINLIGISAAMKYLHENQILHRDLKPANVLLDINFYPKICDFGFSTSFANSKVMSNVGTQAYKAPEIFQGNPYGPAVDVYSFAIMACEIMSENMAYQGIDDFDIKVINNIINGSLRPEFSENVNENLQDLIRKCWDSDPECRPTFAEIFDELSNNYSEYIDIADEGEIEKYISLLPEQSNISNSAEQNSTEKLSQQITDLKKKMELNTKKYSADIAKAQTTINSFKEKNDILSQQITDLKEKMELNTKKYSTDIENAQNTINLLQDQLSEAKKKKNYRIF